MVDDKGGGILISVVPNVCALENPPGDGELILAGNPSSIDIGKPVSTGSSLGVVGL